MRDACVRTGAEYICAFNRTHTRLRDIYRSISILCTIYECYVRNCLRFLQYIALLFLFTINHSNKRNVILFKIIHVTHLFRVFRSRSRYNSEDFQCAEHDNKYILSNFFHQRNILYINIIYTYAHTYTYNSYITKVVDVLLYTSQHRKKFLQNKGAVS